MDAFKDRLSQRAQDSSRAALGHQSCGRALTEAEIAFAEAMMEVYGTGVTEAADLAAGLAEKGVEGPVSGRSDWTAELLADELKAINADLDAAYQEHGYGA